MEHGTISGSKKRPRVERGRSKNGCRTCLSKRVRCDEKHPRCGRCARLELHCEWTSQPPPLAVRRRGLGPIKDRPCWRPQTIVPRAVPPTTQAIDGASQSQEETLPVDHTAAAQSSAQDLPGAQPSETVAPKCSDLPVSEDSQTEGAMIQFSNLTLPDFTSMDIASSMDEHGFDEDAFSSITDQLVLYPSLSFGLLPTTMSLSFTYPMDPAPPIGSNDAQAITFHTTILAPMKSTRRAASSSHSIFLNFAIQDPMALHFLLALSHSELAIYQNCSDRPPLESYLHFQQGSQLLRQAMETLAPPNHITMMLSFLYLYMFWIRRSPLNQLKLRELSSLVLTYTTTFALDELCVSAPSEKSTATLSRILTYIYDRDVFCGFFGCGEAFAGYVDRKPETRQHIWQLSRMPILASEDESDVWIPSDGLSAGVQSSILNLYFSLITVQFEINRYSQSSDAQAMSLELGIKSKLQRIRQDQNILFTTAEKYSSESRPLPLMALVTVTIFHALVIYFHRSRDSVFGEVPTPRGVEDPLKACVSTAYHAVSAGSVQLLERFQWALFIAGIETHDPVHRDWISATISDPVLKRLLGLVTSVKGPSGISMREIRQLVERQSWEAETDLPRVQNL